LPMCTSPYNWCYSSGTSNALYNHFGSVVKSQLRQKNGTIVGSNGKTMSVVGYPLEFFSPAVHVILRVSIRFAHLSIDYCLVQRQRSH
jgi:hypothetical protein